MRRASTQPDQGTRTAPVLLAYPNRGQAGAEYPSVHTSPKTARTEAPLHTHTSTRTGRRETAYMHIPIERPSWNGAFCIPEPGEPGRERSLLHIPDRAERQGTRAPTPLDRSERNGNDAFCTREPRGAGGTSPPCIPRLRRGGREQLLLHTRTQTKPKGTFSCTLRSSDPNRKGAPLHTRTRTSRMATVHPAYPDSG